MSPEQELVQQIREFIRSDQQEATAVVEDLSEQYAEICAQINTRLQRCREFLERGMRSEAVHEATIQPSLLELVDVINFQEVTRWRNTCIDLALTNFPELDLDTIELLRRELSTEEELSPLLKQYRRCVHDGDRDGCIRLLRELRSRDPANPVWPENLEPLEQAQLPDLRTQVTDALEDDDQARLRDLYAEMVHPQRVVETPDELLATVGKSLRAEREREAIAESSQLVRDLEQAFTDKDTARAGTLLERWANLTGDGLLQPDRAMAASVQRVGAWFSAQEAQGEAEERFQEAVREMQGLLLEVSPNAAGVHDAWRKLSAFGRPIPDEVEQAVGAAFERASRARRGRGLKLALLGIVAIIVSMAAALYLWRAHSRGQERKRMITHLATLLQQERYAEIETYLEGVAEQDPAFHRSPQLRHYRAEADQAVQKQSDRRVRYAELKDALSRIREDGFDAPEAQIRHLLQEVQQYAQDEQETTYVSLWRDSWGKWLDRKQQKASGDLRRAIAFLRQEIQAQTDRPFSSLDEEAKALARCEQHRQEAEPFIPDSAPESVEEFNQLVAKVAVWGRQHVDRKKAWQEAGRRLENLRRQLPDALPDLDAYRLLLRQFVTEFPDLDEALPFRRALEQIELYTQAVALRSFVLSHLPAEEGKVEAIRKFLEPDSALSGSVWEPDLRRALEYIDAVESIRNQLRLLAFSKGESFTIQYLEYRPKGEEQWRPLYFPEPLRSRVEKGEDGKPFTVYWGDVYHYVRDDQKPWVEHTSRIFPGKFSTRDYDIRVQRQARDNVVPHGQFLFGFVAESTEVEELDVHLLDGISRLLEDDQMALVPKGWLMKKLVHLFSENFGRYAPGAAEMVRLVDRMNTDAPWLNPNHPEVLKAQTEILDLLNGFPDVRAVVKDVKAQRGLVAKALSRRVRCAGSMQYGEDGSLKPTYVVSDPVSVWVAVPGTATAAAHFKAVAWRDRGGELKFTESAQHDLFAGQVLFAPGDGRTETDILLAVGFDADKSPRFWPGSWPKNRR